MAKLVHISAPLRQVIQRLDAVVSHASHGNPGQHAVGCKFGDGRCVSRNVGHMTNHRAGWFAVELALDEADCPIRIVTCNTAVSGLARAGDSTTAGARGLSHRDYDIQCRVRSKLGNSTVEFVHKRNEPRYVDANRAAKKALEYAPIWGPKEGETRRAVESDLSLRVVGSAESPVESSLLRELTPHFPEPVSFTPDWMDPWRVLPAFHGEHGTLIPQVKVGKYRGDFGIVSDSRGFQLIVEVDGYEYHDATRDSIEADKQRDRKLVAAGWVVVRFTGREVHRFPAECAEEVISILEGNE